MDKEYSFCHDIYDIFNQANYSHWKTWEELSFQIKGTIASDLQGWPVSIDLESQPIYLHKLIVS